MGAAAFKAVTVPPDDHAIYALVGRIASNWAHVERIFDQIIWDIAEIDPAKGACITAQLMSVYARCNTIIGQLTLFERENGVSTQALINKITDIRNRSNGPSEQRNRAVHDPWYVYTNLNQTAQFRAMPAKDLRYGIYPVDLQDLEQTLTTIREFSKRVAALREEISALLASHRKSAE
jgi:hypothetical protein